MIFALFFCSRLLGIFLPPSRSPLAKVMHDDEKYVSTFGAYDWSKAAHASAVYRSTLQRLVTGAATLWNAQGAAFVAVAALTVAAVPAVQARCLMGGWGGAARIVAPPYIILKWRNGAASKQHRQSHSSSTKSAILRNHLSSQNA